ncbi:MAG TPA: response regulator [Candidatus Melainabacteria bacterium]|nr:response regulator [Candidatus Melainabacteria bacterium]
MARILIAEDDQFLSDQIRQWLEFEKFIVDAVYTGPEACEHLQFETYDVVVLDGHLPGMDGIDICKKFRSDGGTTPILMLSGRDQAKDKQAGFEAGANDYLLKPFHLKDLSARLRKLLGETQQS